MRRTLDGIAGVESATMLTINERRGVMPDSLSGEPDYSRSAEVTMDDQTRYARPDALMALWRSGKRSDRLNAIGQSILVSANNLPYGENRLSVEFP